MPRVTFVAADGSTTEAMGEVGQSVMAVAVNAGIEVILAECGGACACGTCHIYVEGGWYERLPAPEEIEREMLTFACDVQANSRLACQIKINDSLSGLIVRAPARQY